jgi:CMP-N-acetylneuraminic acid synthetase
VAKNFGGKKSDILFSCVNLRKKPQKKEKNAKVLKPQKLEKEKNQRKHWFRHYQSKTYFIFIFR